MILQALHKLLIKAEIKTMSPLDLVNWVEGKIDITASGSPYIGAGIKFERHGYVFEEAQKIIVGPKRVELFDYDIMDRFWQNGKLILVTKAFKVFDESTTRVYQSRCGSCQKPAGNPGALRHLRLAGSCVPCTAHAIRGSALWSAQRGIVLGRLRYWYDPLEGILRKL